jgi:ABC-2 type transport system ATP-binding protein
MSDAAVTAAELSFRYGERTALEGVGFEVARGEAFGFLGPNGSGKSTLFKLLSTILVPQGGRASVLGLDLATQAAAIRACIGVVFQSPAVDKKLTVRENLRYAGLLLGLPGRELAVRMDEVMAATKLGERAGDLVGELSGGLRRRVEIAKCLLGRPEVVLLDEASTGLDPAARTDMWAALRSLPGLTVLFTTHLLDEAAEADRLLLLDEGKVVAAGRPRELMRELGGQVLEIEASSPAELRVALQTDFGVDAQVAGDTLRIEGKAVHDLVPRLVERYGERLQRLSLAHPSLRDVFLKKTGKRFVEHEPAAAPARRKR